MRHFFDKILLSAHRKMVVRILLYSVVLISVGIVAHVYMSIEKMERKKAIFSEYFALQDSLQSIQIQASDSVLEASRSAVKKGIINGWDDAAWWIENIRAYAFISGIEITYQIDSLISFPEGGEHFFKIPIHVEATPSDGKFETVMAFIQDVCSDTTMITNLEKIEFTADELGINQTHFTLIGWIKL